jgi:hypothetical protein
MRKVALRLGELADRRRWRIRSEVTRQLLSGALQLQDLKENDVTYDVQQKGVDRKMALDIAGLAYKRLVDRIIEHIDGLHNAWPRKPTAVTSLSA